jgi:predicted enzyme related to lactoylglutathione lyase
VASFKTILIPSTDLPASRELYRALLGAEPSADAAYYVGFDVDGQHIGLVPGSPAVRPQLHVDDMAAAIALITSAGGTVLEDAKDVGGGRLVALVRDPSGAEIGLLDDSGAGS